VELNETERAADLLYARGLWIGTALALALIAIETVAYVGGIVSPYIPLTDLPSVWGLPMRDYLAAANVPAGWGWVALAGRGDYLNFVGIAVLASVTIGCHVRLLVHYLRQRDRTFAVLVAAQVIVMLAAASGLLNST
jgi:hypothetical protein